MIDMLKRLNHIAIAVPDLDIAVNNYKNAFDAKVTPKQELIKTALNHCTQYKKNSYFKYSLY